MRQEGDTLWADGSAKERIGNREGLDARVPSSNENIEQSVFGIVNELQCSQRCLYLSFRKFEIDYRLEIRRRCRIRDRFGCTVLLFKTQL